jgi:hypothetical protein
MMTTLGRIDLNLGVHWVALPRGLPNVSLDSPICDVVKAMQLIHLGNYSKYKSGSFLLGFD